MNLGVGLKIIQYLLPCQGVAPQTDGVKKRRNATFLGLGWAFGWNGCCYLDHVQIRLDRLYKSETIRKGSPQVAYCRRREQLQRLPGSRLKHNTCILRYM